MAIQKKSIPIRHAADSKIISSEDTSIQTVALQRYCKFGVDDYGSIEHIQVVVGRTCLEKTTRGLLLNN